MIATHTSATPTATTPNGDDAPVPQPIDWDSVERNPFGQPYFPLNLTFPLDPEDPFEDAKYRFVTARLQIVAHLIVLADEAFDNGDRKLACRALCAAIKHTTIPRAPAPRAPTPLAPAPGASPAPLAASPAPHAPAPAPAPPAPQYSGPATASLPPPSVRTAFAQSRAPTPPSLRPSVASSLTALLLLVLAPLLVLLPRAASGGPTLYPVVEFAQPRAPSGSAAISAPVSTAAQSAPSGGRHPPAHTAGAPQAPRPPPAIGSIRGAAAMWIAPRVWTRTGPPQSLVRDGFAPSRRPHLARRFKEAASARRHHPPRARRGPPARRAVDRPGPAGARLGSSVSHRPASSDASAPQPASSSRGESGADPLLALVYDHLRAIAQQRMSAENAGHTLQATALVHEAYLRIGQGRQVPFTDRAHFFATAAEAMRRILIDHARAKGAAKRRPSADGWRSVVDLAEHPDSDQVMALDSALQRLEQAEPEVAAVVRLRFFAGLSGDDTAEALSISPRQVDRLWAYARAWLARELPPAE